MKKLKVKLTFTEGILGMSPNSKEVFREYIASKSPDASTIEDEVASIGVDAVEAKGSTVFPRTEDGVPFIWDYQIKGFFKDTCGGLRRVKSSESAKIKAYKKEIDKLIFIVERRIHIDDIESITLCQRPLRAQTMQGERISIASSEEINAGASITFTVMLLEDSHEKLVREWLDYGILSGLGQWRNSGKGRFRWEEIK